MKIRLTILCLFLSAMLSAQIIELPLSRSKITQTKQSASPQSESTHDVVNMPFWDDFSTSYLFPDSTKWLWADNVRISNSTAINAPTLNVAVFDGVDGFGAAYNPTTLINGKTDSLTSQYIDLSSLEADQRDSVYLSFFWQLNGRGELPEEADSLTLLGKNALGLWETLWSKKGGVENENIDFEQVLIQIPPRFWSSEFQFKFQAYGNLTGKFDTWLVDYIFLNQSRSAVDMAYLDRALTRRPSFLTGPYSAMPTEQFFSNPNKYVNTTNSEFYNLNSVFQPVLYSTIVTDLVSGNEIERLNDEVLAIPLPGAFERREFTSPALNPALLDREADSLQLETKYFIRSGDTYFIEDIIGTDTVFAFNVDYRVNDTVSMVTMIDDYFAYDDGEPDFAAGINQRGGQLAYRFYAEERALLTHIDINFPFTEQAGQPIEIFVRDELNNSSESLLYQNSYSILRPESIGNLSAYQLDSPVYVQDTFFIGFAQATNEFLAVGLDKNNDSGGEMFYNVSGIWEKNKYVEGSFLMRPRFDKSIAVVEQPSGEARLNIDIYPNPSNGLFYINSEVTNLEVFDNYGNKQSFATDTRDRGVWVDLSRNKNGIYLLKFLSNGKPVAKRVILNE